jgi:hypothetical protein
MAIIQAAAYFEPRPAIGLATQSRQRRALH